MRMRDFEFWMPDLKTKTKREGFNFFQGPANHMLQAARVGEESDLKLEILDDSAEDKLIRSHSSQS